MYGIIEALLLFLAIICFVSYAFLRLGVLVMIGIVMLVIGSVMILLECMDGE